MSNFSLWLIACQADGTMIYPLEDDGRGTEMYQTYKTYSDGRQDFRTAPVYHVWQGDKAIYTGLSYQEAFALWNKEKKA